VIKHGLQRKDTPKEYGPHKTLVSRFIRCRRIGVFDRILAGLFAAVSGSPMSLLRT
jgi:hypothetical protein